MSRTIRTFLVLLAALAATAQAQGIRVVLNEREMQFDQPPAMIEGRLMVPLRGIFEGLNADVLYDARTRSIKATKGSTVVELTLGSRQGLLNGRTVYLDVPAATVGGRTMVPLRFVSEALGADVKWQGATRTVRISEQGMSGPEGDPGDADPVPPPPTSWQPPPPPPPAQRAPVIDAVIHNATRPLQEGDSLDVIMTGESGGDASFQILGVTGDIPMREVRNGRYEGRFVVPRGASVRQGVLTGRLALNGRESIAEASRPISIQNRPVPPSNPTSNLIITRQFPPANATVTDTRPVIGVETSGSFGNLNARVLVDRLDVTAQVQQQNGRILWNPGFDLTPGPHAVELTLADNTGTPVRSSWSFTVRSQAGPRVFTDPGNNFSLTIPAGWVEDNSDPSAALHLRRGPDTEFGIFVTGPDTLNNVVVAIKQGLAGKGDRVTSQGPIQISGQPGTILEYAARNGSDGLAIAVVTSSHSYIMLAESRVSNDPQVQQEMQSMLDSMRVR